MKFSSILVFSVLSLSFASCGMSARGAARANKKASNAQEKVSKERLKLVDQYKKCIMKADGDPKKVEACDSYLKAAEALQ